MIDRAEILAVATDLSLAPEVVEKDYVLGWLLAGIYAHEALAPVWTFKGGTCLKSATSRLTASRKISTSPSARKSTSTPTSYDRRSVRSRSGSTKKSALRFPPISFGSTSTATTAAASAAKGASTTAGRCGDPAACRGSSSI